MTLEKNKLTGETKKYYYDSENKMRKYEHQTSDISPVDITAEYKYDIYGRRIQKNVNNTITNFTWEGDSLAMELNSANQPIRKYFIGTNMDDYEGHLEYSEVTDWTKIFDVWNNQGGYSYIKDQVGTIYKVWDHKAKAIADSRAYDSFGNLVNQTGTTKTPLGFQGKYYDSESGLNYFYHRYYSPSIGRFTSEDPILFRSQDGNFYQFANANPIKYTDPFGLESCSKCPSSPPNPRRSEYCHDVSIFNLHPGLDCFRAMDGSGRHCCYDKSSTLKNGHEDDVCPASWKTSQGNCIWNPFKLYAHFVFDVFSKLPKWDNPGPWEYHSQR